MSLYGRTDSNENVAKVAYASALENVLPQAEVIFVDNTEAQLAQNRARGIDAPGWWRYFTFTDCEGNTRHKAELLVTIADPESNEDETQSDDTVAADDNYEIWYEAGGNAYYYESDPEMTAWAVEVNNTTETTNTGIVSFQWQRKASNGRWVNISDGGDYTITTDYGDESPTGNGPYGAEDYWYSTLTVADPGQAGDGTKFRVKLTSENGPIEIVSEEFTLVYD